MGGLLLLLALCVVMAVASFLAGALPLSMTLSTSQMRLLSSIGVGILVGTSLIIIIPEGIEAAASRGDEHAHAHRVRTVAQRTPWSFDLDGRSISEAIASIHTAEPKDFPLDVDIDLVSDHVAVRRTVDRVPIEDRQDEAAEGPAPEGTTPEEGHKDEHGHEEEHHDDDDEHDDFPSLEIGLSMILGFVLMFLIDRLPRHAADSAQNVPQLRHISLDNLGGGGGSSGGTDSTTGDEEADGFLGSLAPTPRRARSLATTIGLVIHAAADGIAMGASSTSSDMKLGFIVFIAIMIHKAPAAFGLTSVLLKQGLSKRAARGHLIVFSLAAPFGALATWLLITILGGGNMDSDAQQWWTGMLLLFSGGTFLYVAMHAMQEESGSHGSDHGPGLNGYSDGGSQTHRKPKGPQMRDTLATVVGMLLPLLTQFGHHHH